MVFVNWRPSSVSIRLLFKKNLKYISKYRNYSTRSMQRDPHSLYVNILRKFPSWMATRNNVRKAQGARKCHTPRVSLGCSIEIVGVAAHCICCQKVACSINRVYIYAVLVSQPARHAVCAVYKVSAGAQLPWGYTHTSACWKGSTLQKTWGTSSGEQRLNCVCCVCCTSGARGVVRTHGNR